MDELGGWQAETAELRFGASGVILELEPADWAPASEICLEGVRVISHSSDRHTVSGRRRRAVDLATPTVDALIVAELEPAGLTMSRPGWLARLAGERPRPVASGVCLLREALPTVIEIHGGLTIVAPCGGEPAGGERATSGRRLRLVR